MEKIKVFIKNILKNNLTIILLSLFSAILFSLLAYNQVFTNIIANPDGIIEGYRIYNNVDWATAGCGRWFIRYFSLLHRNRVIAKLVLIEACFFNWLTSFVIIKIFNIKSKLVIILIPIIACVTPSTIAQLSYTCIGSIFSLAGALAALFVYFNKSKNIFINIIGILFLTISLGCYQSYIGLAAVLVVFYIIDKIIKDDYKIGILFFGIRNLVGACISGILYYLIFKLELVRYNLTSINRASQFSLSGIFDNFFNSVKKAYISYFSKLFDGILYRDYLISLMLVLIFIVAVSIILRKKKDGKYKEMVIISLFWLLIPFFSNIISIITPFNDVTVIMSYQTWLFSIFGLIIILNSTKLLKTSYIILLSCLLITYIISANMTFISYGKSHQMIYEEMSKVMEKIKTVDGYELNQTPILMIGFPKEKELRENNVSYKMAIDMPSNVAFWEDLTGTTISRRWYFSEFLFVDAKNIKEDAYRYLISKKEIQDMNSWPSEGSIIYFEDYIIVKFDDVYY